MDHSTIMNTFEFLEKNTTIPEYEIGNWKAWSIIRALLTFDLSIPNNQKIKKRRVFEILKKPGAIYWYLRSFIQLGLLRNKRDIDVLVRTSSDTRRDLVDGVFKCIYFDDIIKNGKDVKWLLMEDLGYCHERFLPTQNKINIYSEGMRFYVPLSKPKINMEEIISVKNKILEELESLRKNAEHPEVIDGIIRFMNNRFESVIIKFMKTKKAYKRLFKKTNPKLFFMVCSYGYEGIIAAAKELNIPVVELQHGIIHKNHFGYIYNKNLLKYREKFLVPDFLLLYDKRTKDLLVKTSFFDKDKIFVTGNPRIEYWNSKAKDSKNKLEENIFVALEGDDEHVLKFLDKGIGILKERGTRVKIRLKLHPGEVEYLKEINELKDKYPEYVEILSPSSLNLYENILKSKFHVSVSSTTHFEAINLNTPTLVLKLPGWRNVEDLIRKKYAKLANTPKDFADFVTHAVLNDKTYKEWLKNTMKSGGNLKQEKGILDNIAAIENILKTRCK